MDRLARYRSLVDDWSTFAEVSGRPLAPCVWGNPLRATPASLEERFRRGGVAYEPLAGVPFAYRLSETSTPGSELDYLAGLYHIQEAVSMLPPLLLEPRPGERVLDLCAAPGNKTAQIAAAMQNRGTVVANDISALRSRALRGTLDRLGIANTCVTIEDAANYPSESGLFDRVLADVPCSCEGTLRRHPDVATVANPVPPGALAARQAAILRKAVQLCRPGGRIVYATCTFAPEENECVVDEVLRASEGVGLRLLPARLSGLAVSPGLATWQGRRLHPSLDHAIRLWPHQNDTGGFFIAVLQKGEADAPEPEEVSPGVHLSHRVSTAERGEILGVLGDRFGIPEACFDGYEILRTNRKAVTLVARDHRPPAHPATESLGIAFLRINLRFPKLTTAAAMICGAAATRNAVELSDGEAAAFVARRTVPLDDTRRGGCAGTGYVVARHGGVPLGLGLYRADSGTMQSLFPKAWSQKL